jgi:hypothetical protein
MRQAQEQISKRIFSLLKLKCASSLEQNKCSAAASSARRVPKRTGPDERAA